MTYDPLTTDLRFTKDASFAESFGFAVCEPMSNRGQAWLNKNVPHDYVPATVRSADLPNVIAKAEAAGLVCYVVGT